MKDSREFVYRDEDFRFLAAKARALAGIELPDQKRELIYTRLSRRLRALGLQSFNEYCQHLDDVSEAGHFINAITTNLTHFFREPHHFEHLAKQVKGWAQRDEKRITLWSAGCSTGMEPYSMAITMQESLDSQQCQRVRILATDIDTTVLAQAQQGLYREEDLSPLSAAQRQKYFIAQGTQYQVRPLLRDMISFKPLNLMGPWPMKGPFHAIFCRNVLIYFSRETQANLIERFASLLMEGGTLCLGHSESVRGLNSGLQHRGRTIYEKNHRG